MILENKVQRTASRAFWPGLLEVEAGVDGVGAGERELQSLTAACPHLEMYRVSLHPDLQGAGDPPLKGVQERLLLGGIEPSILVPIVPCPQLFHEKACLQLILDLEPEPVG